MSSVPTDSSAVAPAHGAAQGSRERCDAEALRLARAGDRQAFARVAIAWQDRIYNALRKILGNEHEAADLTQETFVRALDHLSSFRGQSSAYTWLFRIAMNLATSRQRQLKRRRTIAAGQLSLGNEESDPLDRQANSTPAPDRIAQQRERDEQVMAALNRLPEDQRSLLVLRDIEGMEYQQIADVLAVPLGTLKSRLFRARMALKDELKAYFDEQEAVA